MRMQSIMTKYLFIFISAQRRGDRRFCFDNEREAFDYRAKSTGPLLCYPASEAQTDDNAGGRFTGHRGVDQSELAKTDQRLR